MHNTSLRLARAISLAALLVAAPVVGAVAQEAAPAADAAAAAPAEAAPIDPNAVVATVGDETITEADLGFAAEDMTQDLAQMPAEERRAFLVRVLIDMKVMAKAARDAGMDQSEVFAQRQKYLEERALRRAYFNEAIAGAVTEEAARAEYETFVADFEPQEEVRASHILVATEEEANALKAEIDGGADFATLAQENSTDTGSAVNGGELGFFSQGMMVPEFEEAAFALAEPGDVSAPVQSQFGWHIIRLEEKRQAEAPTFEQVAPQIQQQLLMRSFSDTVSGLMDGVEVDIADPELAARFEAQEAAEDAAAAGETAAEDAPAQ